MFISSSARTISQEGYDASGAELVPLGSVVMSSRAPIGHLAIATREICTNQGCKTFVCGDEIDSTFLFFALRFLMSAIRELGSGATFSEVSKSQLESFEILIPDVEEQRRIAATLSEQMVAVEQSREAIELQRRWASRLVSDHLVRIYGALVKVEGARLRLGDLAQLLPSRSISSDGDAVIKAVTTACLTEAGFDFRGMKTARMLSKDVADCILRAGEILVARSNTPELVGRAAMFPGGDRPIVASDLTVRIKTGEKLLPAFLAGYLSFLFVSKYWNERAGGASGSMKKITRAQIEALLIPVPSLEEQDRVVRRAKETTDAISRAVSAIDHCLRAVPALSSSLLRQAFSGSA
jgi:type I restriction enzyme S subunit